MSSQSVVVLVSAACVSSNKFESIQNKFINDDRFNNEYFIIYFCDNTNKQIHSIKVINTTKILLNEEQQKSLPIENVEQFCKLKLHNILDVFVILTLWIYLN